MSFNVHVAGAVEVYIRTCERLTISDQDRVLSGLVEELSESADKFFNLNQMPKLQNHFWYDFILMTDARELRECRFICDAQGFVYGVCEIRFDEERSVLE